MLIAPSTRRFVSKSVFGGLVAALALASGCSFFSVTPSSTAPSPEGSAPASEPYAAAPSSPSETTMASAEAQPAAQPAPAPPRPVSVTIRNSCGETVKLFFGDKPKFGSGRYSSIGGNTSTSHSFMPGDMLWIVDDAQQGLSSVTVSEGARKIEVADGCAGLRMSYRRTRASSRAARDGSAGRQSRISASGELCWPASVQSCTLRALLA